MNFYVTSDQHFFHENIIKYQKRPFTNNFDGVIHNITTIGQNYNKIIKDEDLVFHLGDLACGKFKTFENVGHILKNLKGRKILIKGNHDKWPNEYYKKYFESVHEYLIFGNTFMCHYPCYEPSKIKYTIKIETQYRKILEKNNCSKVIHGHIHNSNPSLWDNDGYERTNVSVDYTPNNYYPIKIFDSNLVNILKDLYK